MWWIGVALAGCVRLSHPVGLATNATTTGTTVLRAAVRTPSLDGATRAFTLAPSSTRACAARRDELQIRVPNVSTTACRMTTERFGAGADVGEWSVECGSTRLRGARDGGADVVRGEDSDVAVHVRSTDGAGRAAVDDGSARVDVAWDGPLVRAARSILADRCVELDDDPPLACTSPARGTRRTATSASTCARSSSSRATTTTSCA